jgi:hypothetical protein
MRPILLAAALLAMGTNIVFSCESGYHDECSPEIAGFKKCICVPDLPPVVPQLPQLPTVNLSDAVFPGLKKLVEAGVDSNNQELAAAARNVEALGTKLDKETQTAITNAVNNPVQAVKDAVVTHLKAVNDAVDAVRASARFAERTVNGYGDVLSSAESRVREGKVVDAVWHLYTDKLGTENENAAKFMQESETARQAAQVAVATYAGPAGTAAFAAWEAYNSSGHNVEAAIRAGVYAYVVRKGYARANAMPTRTVDALVKKAAVTAAVHGMAVAAAGGNRDDILRAASEAGLSVIVQGGQAFVTKKYANRAKSNADTFCMDAVKKSCTAANRWIKQSKDRLEQYKATADALPNSVPTEDGLWAISWDKQSLLDRYSMAPGVVLTYIGEGSSYREQVLDIASVGDPTKFNPPVIDPTNWAAFRAPGGTKFYFDRVSPPGAASSVTPDDLLRANTLVNVRPGPAGGGWGDAIDIITPGETVKVLEVVTADTKIGPQEWIRFERVQQ